MRASDLHPGARFRCAGVEYELIYLNSCRAHCRLAKAEVVMIGEKSFERAKTVDISPGARVDELIAGEADAAPRMKVVGGSEASGPADVRTIAERFRELQEKRRQEGQCQKTC